MTMLENKLQYSADRVAPEKAVHLEPPFCTIISRNTTRGIKMKTCTKCRQEKESTEFYEHRSDCIVCNLKYCKEYRKTESRKITVRKYAQTEKCRINQKRYCERYPERRRAKESVYIEIRAGRMASAKTLACYYCPKPAEEYHHWRGYAKRYWLDVVPACVECHKYIHQHQKLLEQDND